jgi:hypothetical protein
MRLILIHGRAQQGKDPVALQHEWEEAWEKGLEDTGLHRPTGLEVSFPFYGDLLDDLIRHIEAPLLVDVMTRGELPDNPTVRTEAELLLEMTGPANISTEEIQQQLEPGVPMERGVENTVWVRAAARLLDRTPLGFPTISTVTHDVAVYLANPGVRSRIDRIVSNSLGDGPSAVIAHSLGTVVAYNVLATNQKSIAVRRLVTLGSPLGYDAVRNRIEWPIAMPRYTASWFNARDPRDIVAGFPLDQRRFPVQPAIENKSDVHNDSNNPHDIGGYLQDTTVVKRIWEALSNSTGAH